VLEPIPQTVAAARELGRYQPDLDILGSLQATAGRVQALVPDLVGMSLAWLDHGVSFTLVASDAEIAVLDAVQYLAGGPCVDGVHQEQGWAAFEEDLLDEQRWQLLAQSTAARGVRSTLTLLLTEAEAVVGTANLYGGSDHAFDGHHDQVAELLGARVSDIVRNADLSFTTRQVAEQAPDTIRARDAVDRAVGMIIGSMKVDAETAGRRLEEAAKRAGISVPAFARALINLRQDQP
jgi:transcriptional regulator with GAF, ATPase, and Fis domain